MSHSGAFGLELAHDSVGKVTIVDWKKGGQADRLHGKKLEHGMVLVSVAGVDVTVLRLDQILLLMDSSSRPVVLGWKRADTKEEDEEEHGEDVVVGGGGHMMDDLAFPLMSGLQDPLFDESMETPSVYGNMMSGGEDVKMVRELQGPFF